MKRNTIIALILFFVLGACTQEPLQGAVAKEAVVEKPVQVQEVESPKEGTMVLSVTAEPFDTNAKNNVGKFTLLEVSGFHKALGFWTKISSADVTISTAEKTARFPYATAVLREGVYEQLRIKLSDVSVQKEGIETNPVFFVREVKIPFSFEIKPDEETHVTVHFLFGKSLHKQGAIFAPVVEVVSGVQKQEFFMNARGVMGKEKFDLAVFEAKEKEEKTPVAREVTPKDIAEQEARRAALDAAVIKISPGEKKKLVVNKK